jgi:hypothetical protein
MVAAEVPGCVFYTVSITEIYMEKLVRHFGVPK